MLLQAIVQLHILLSAAPALAGWTPYLHAVPLAPGQAVYGVRAGRCPVAADAQNRPQARSAPSAFCSAQMAGQLRQAQGLAVPVCDFVSAAGLQTVPASPHGPRAP